MRKVYEQLIETGHSHDEALRVIADQFDLSIDAVIAVISERKSGGGAHPNGERSAVPSAINKPTEDESVAPAVPSGSDSVRG